MSRAARIALALIFISVPLLLAEGMSAVYLRYLSRNPRSLAEHNKQRHRYEPYRGHELTPGWNLDGVRHDAQGFRRIEDVAQPKPDGTYRVFLMGGSAAYGLGAGAPFPDVSIRNDQTIDAKLEQRLRDAVPGKRVEVINAAVTAYWTHQHLIYLLEHLLDYDPDLIIFMDGINDHYHTQANHNQFLSYQYSLPLRVGELNAPTVSEVLRTMFEWAKQYSHAAFMLNEGIDRVFGWSAAPEDPCQREVIPPDQLTPEYAAQFERISRRTWVRTLRTVLLLLRDQGVQAIVAVQPELVFDQTRGRSSGDAKLFEIERSWRPAFYHEKKAFLRPIANRLAQETATTLGARYVDLTDVFDDRDQYFIDYCHLSEAGGAKVADQLAPVVIEAAQRADKETTNGHPVGP